MPGDVVAVGPTGDTESTLTTDPEAAPSSAPEADYSAVGHSGDPVAVDPGWRNRRAATPGRTRRGRRAAAVPVRTATCTTPPARASWSGTSRTRHHHGGCRRPRLREPGHLRRGRRGARLREPRHHRARHLEPRDRPGERRCTDLGTDHSRPTERLILGRGRGLGSNPCPRSFRGHTGDGVPRRRSACQRSVIAG